MDRYKIFFIVLFTIFSLVCGRRVLNPCDEGKLACDNGECIRRWDWCNDKSDCTDHSDEKYCKTRPFDTVDYNCTDKHFACKDGMCFPASVRCDGEWDCTNNDDEENCETADTVEVESTSSPAKEPEYLTTSSTPAPRRQINLTPSPPVATDFYDRRRTDDSYNNNNRRYDYAPSSSPAPPPIYDPNSAIDRNVNYRTTHDARYPDQTYNQRGPDIHPGRNFPNNQQPHIPSHTQDRTPQRRRDRTGTRQDPSRTDYPYVDRERPVMFPPRSILYPPRTTSSSTRRNVRSPNYSPFYFVKNYTKDAVYKYGRIIQDAKAWLLARRDGSYTWGRDTPRAMIALSLISNSFKSDVGENELMRKSLQTYLGIKVLKNETGIEKISTTRLAVYINALLATCQNPRDFMDLDLVEILHYTQSSLERHQGFVNPLIYLSLCLTDMPVSVNYLEHFLLNAFPTEISKDIHILATTAMACAAQRNPSDNSIRDKLDEAARSLLSQMNRDGSFGSKYSTALAAQALMSVNTSLRWDHEKTLNYLAQQKQEDGSFGDMQSTYYTLLALSGRSLVHLRNTLCDPVDIKTERTPDDILNAPGPRISVLYTLRVGYPETFSTGMQLSVPEGTTFYDIMRVAAYQDPRFKFNYEVSRGNLYNIHTIANIPNDPERGTFWTLYHMKPSDRIVDFRQRFLDNIIGLIPKDGDEMIFWYLSDFY